ncbi:MAG: polymorphic toxin type 34 domain-containing protein [Terriglobales bacterium]
MSAKVLGLAAVVGSVIFSKGDQYVGHPYIEDEARELIRQAALQGIKLSMCEALEELLRLANFAGDRKKRADIIATQKQHGCRNVRKRG